MPKSNSLQICLVKTGPTTPMITTLELRPLGNDTYTTQTGTLKLLDRHYYASESDIFGIRYPDDVYDRKWDLVFPSNEIWINTTANVNQSRPFELPQAVMKRAITPKKATEPLTLLFLSDENPSDKFYVYFHFAEIQALRANDSREFDIVWEDTTFLPPYSPKRFQSDTLFNKLPKEQGTVKLVRTKGSTLPPLISAIEAFKVMDLPYSETNTDDVVSMKNIEAAYALNFISWQGDPCLPRQYKWDYIECSYTSISTPPRIISL
ncbi:unnamed protein product [Microthlaspi erraticum]|uniref:Malectin-like domain-containing protein n=1 Tax=Microthlaspi erraticum TaxID=1685480 RepID=A0A6D2HNN2_9BRAS|nr:unnamed protein product [Microthlaspi erraticum]